MPVKVVLNGLNFSGDEAVQKYFKLTESTNKLQQEMQLITGRKCISNKGNFVEQYKYAVGGTFVTPMNVMKVIMFGGV